MYSVTDRRSLNRQARFLRALAEAVRAYNESDGTKIDMGWLAGELEEAAQEAEQEAEA